MHPRLDLTPDTTNHLPTVEELFKKYQFEVEVEDFTSQPASKLITAIKPGVRFDIVLLQRNAEWVLYDLSSNILPRELYSDSVRKGFSEAERSKEIFTNIQNMLAGKVKFHSSPKLFNKQHGYITVLIDGIPSKISIRENDFNLLAHSR